jgi:uncharacterized protein YciI/uncharacterized protein YndB with AHSA1/START domain
VTAINIKKSINVETSQQRAFRVFTDGIDRWWPRDHHIGKSPLERFIIEPRTGGRWYSTCKDGSEVDVGRVIKWEPYSRVVLTWQITGEWKFDPDFITEIEVTFTSEGPRKTRVELEHRNIERFGAHAGEIRKTFESDGGWSTTLGHYAKSLGGPKYLMTYETTPESLQKAPANLPSHRERLDEFQRRGKLLMAGPVIDGSGRAFGVFTTKESAEEFIAGDPFVTGGVVTKWSVVEWMEVLD